jgi:hypothetical protein
MKWNDNLSFKKEKQERIEKYILELIKTGDHEESILQRI